MGTNMSRRMFLGIGGITCSAILAGLGFNIFNNKQNVEIVDVPIPDSNEPRYGGVSGYLASALGLVQAPLGAAGVEQGDVLQTCYVVVHMQHQFVDVGVCGENVTWNDLLDQDLQMRSFLFQHESWAQVFCFGEDEGAILFDPSPLSDLGGRAVDIILAKDDDLANIVDPSLYEVNFASGIMTFKLADIPYSHLRCCVLFVANSIDDARTSSWWCQVVNESSYDVCESCYITCDSVMDEFAVKIVDTNIANYVDVAVFVSGIDEAYPFAELDEDGILRGNFPSAVMSEMRVVVRDKAVAPIGAIRNAYGLSSSSMRLVYKDTMPNSEEIASVLEAAEQNKTIYSYLGHYTDIVQYMYYEGHGAGSLVYPAASAYPANTWGDYYYTYFDDLASPKYGTRWGTYDNEYYNTADNSTLLDAATGHSSTWSEIIEYLNSGETDSALGNTHGFSLPSDSHATFGEHGLLTKSWWQNMKPLHTDHGGWIGVSALCVHAQVSVVSDRHATNNDDLASLFYYRVVEAKPRAADPYVIFVFYHPNNDGGDSASVQAAHAFLKLKLDSISGFLKLRKVLNV